MLNKTLNSILNFKNREAFFIDDISYSYSDFGNKITALVTEINKYKNIDNQIIGIITDINFSTYAGIYAVWYSGCTFVPLSTNIPNQRNKNIVNQLNISIVINTTDNEIEFIDYSKTNVINSNKCNSTNTNIKIPNYKPDNLSYILFTSGSTGEPKAVPISNKNINSFYNNFMELNYKINENDKFSQFFELTFDMSILSYIIPLSIGASVYPPIKKGVKHLSIIKTIKNYNLTFVSTVPSTVNILKPYFASINLPSIKYMIFAAEALTYSAMDEWQNCVKNAEIINCFGPTEATIVFTEYKWKRNSKNSSFNNNLPIGKAFEENSIIIIDENNNLITDNKKGELCVTGNQVCKGYLNNSDNENAFINISNVKYYRTGDIVFKLNDGNIMYVGRTDNQIQIQGHRVELSDVDFGIKAILPKNECISVSLEINNALHIIAFVKKLNINTNIIKEQLAEHLPYYMLPNYIFSLNEFPYSINGKIDRNELIKISKKLIADEK